MFLDLGLRAPGEVGGDQLLELSQARRPASKRLRCDERSLRSRSSLGCIDAVASRSAEVALSVASEKRHSAAATRASAIRSSTRLASSGSTGGGPWFRRNATIAMTARKPRPTYTRPGESPLFGAPTRATRAADGRAPALRGAASGRCAGGGAGARAGSGGAGGGGAVARAGAAALSTSELERSDAQDVARLERRLLDRRVVHLDRRPRPLPHDLPAERRRLDARVGLRDFGRREDEVAAEVAADRRDRARERDAAARAAARVDEQEFRARALLGGAAVRTTRAAARRGTTGTN
jgi:hypothetical protein